MEMAASIFGILGLHLAPEFQKHILAFIVGLFVLCLRNSSFLIQNMLTSVIIEQLVQEM